MANREKYVKCTTVEFDRMRLNRPVIPYSLMVAASDLLPEAGSDAFSTMAFIPFTFETKYISFQITQELLVPSKLTLLVGKLTFDILLSPKQTTVSHSINTTFQQGEYVKFTVENVNEDSDTDQGDITSFMIFLHGYVM